MWLRHFCLEIKARFVRADKRNQGLLPFPTVSAAMEALQKPPYDMGKVALGKITMRHTKDGFVAYTPFLAELMKTPAPQGPATTWMTSTQLHGLVSPRGAHRDLHPYPAGGTQPLCPIPTRFAVPPGAPHSSSHRRFTPMPIDIGRVKQAFESPRSMGCTARPAEASPRIKNAFETRFGSPRSVLPAEPMGVAEAERIVNEELKRMDRPPKNARDLGPASGEDERLANEEIERMYRAREIQQSRVRLGMTLSGRGFSLHAPSFVRPGWPS
jgi:hypothetical protein